MTHVQHIVNLLIRHRHGELSDEESLELQSWIVENKELFEELESDKIFYEIAQDHSSKQKVFAVLENRIKLPKKHNEESVTFRKQPVVHIFGMRRRWVAVAVSLLLIIGAYVYIVGGNAKNGQAVLYANKFKNDVPPGGNKATLTLAGGSTIILDSTHDGTLSKEDGARIEKTADGTLVYKATPSTGSMATGQRVVYNTLTTPRGGQYFLELSDGSKIWLNAASSLRYPVAFTGKERKVELTGEAYFEIAKSTASTKANAKPFIVDILPSSNGAKGGQVKVFGTHFNIDAYPDEVEIKTTLLEGSIQLSKANQSVMLSPGQQAQTVVDENTDNGGQKRIKVISDADTEEVISWKNGITSFDNADIKSIMRKIARWYDADIVYEGNIPDRIFMGGIPRNSNLSEVLKALELSKIHFEIEGRKIIVKP